MLFNSYVFITVFLPVTLVVFFALGRANRRDAAIVWLVAASLFFYGWWNPGYLALIAASIAFNFGVGRALGLRAPGSPARRGILTFGIAANLGALAWFKYAGFLAATVNAVAGTRWQLGEIILPLGISFFTFTQIAYLVDAYRDEVREYQFTHYALFVTYFPHLIAGPVLHHREMMPQFGNRTIYRFDALNFATGTSYFAIGLFKKVVIADGIAVYARPVFAAAAAGSPVSTLDAWGGVLAYTFQLYFDFSGYSDMAIGLALMMGVRLPLNFDSPYKATNIIDFWRRWHMTLSRFLRDYLYFALGGNRRGDVRRYVNLFLTMLLGGLWHGAGWTFVIWGALHGVYLMVNHGWQALRRRLGMNPTATSAAGVLLAWLLTFVAVVIGWVFFRAESLDAAMRLLRSMFGFEGGALSAPYAAVVGDSTLGRWLAMTSFKPRAEWLLAGSLLAVASLAFFAPNAQQILGRYYWEPRGSAERAPAAMPALWAPRRAYAIALGSLTVIALLGMNRVSEFLYFQF